MSGVKTRPPARRAIASTKRARPSSSPSMKVLIVAPWGVSSSTSAIVARRVSVVVASEVGLSPTGQVCSWLAVGDHEHDGLSFGMPTQVARSEHQGMLQVRALPPIRLHFSQLDGRHPPGQSVEPDDLERILPEAGFDEVVECQRRLLHRAPASVVHHREGEVDAQRHSRADPALRLGDLEVADVQHDAAGGESGPAQCVGHGTRGVDRQLVAEDPGPSQAGGLISCASLVVVVVATADASS